MEGFLKVGLLGWVYLFRFVSLGLLMAVLLGVFFLVAVCRC